MNSRQTRTRSAGDAARGPADDLSRRFAETRRASVALAVPLSDEDCALQSMPDASPVKWHLAHTTWFFEVFVLEPFEPGFEPFDASFRFLFNSYYVDVGDRYPRPARGLLSRPGRTRVEAWRRQVDERIVRLLAAPALPAAVRQRVELGIQHEQQHQELMLTDLKHLFSHNPARPAYVAGWPLTQASSAPLEWVPFEGGLVTCGHSAAEPGRFAFDNETPAHRVWLEPFALASQPVTNATVLAFIEDGGYRRAAHWMSLGWDWVVANRIGAPGYWQGGPDGWEVFTLRGPAPVSPDVPACHLSWFEADAIARWAGARLPTEFEWETAAAEVPIRGNLVESGVFHPLGLQSRPRAGTCAQLYGDVWEWTASPYAPYPGFRADAGALGEYNGKFMCNQFVLRGGSCVTPAAQLRATYRNFFPAESRWQFSGLRLARAAG